MKKWIALTALAIACCTVVAQVKVGGKRTAAPAVATAGTAG